MDRHARERSRGGLPWFLRSLALRLVILVVIFVTVPVMIYQQFRAADQEKQELLLQSAQLQGELIARSLVRLLQDTEGGIPPDLSDNLSELVEGDAQVKVLLRPADVAGAYGFFYVAAVPSVTADALEFEREFLIDQGLLGRLGMTCSGNMPLALRLPMGSDGREQLLTSITPVNTDFGCWAIIISQASEAYLGSSIGRPYWNTPEVRVAAMVYLASAVMILVLFLGVWRNLSQFGRLARQIGFNESHASFAAQNKVPELHSVATDFDRLVESLRRSAELYVTADRDLVWDLVGEAASALQAPFDDVFVRHYDVQFTFDGDGLFEAARKLAVNAFSCVNAATQHAGIAVAHGADWSDAFRAVTLTPAAPGQAWMMARS